MHFARCQSSPCPAGRAAGAAACTLSPSWRGTARDTQPRPSGEQCHTETQGQSAARDERLHSLLFFPAPFVKQALMAELWKNNYSGITHSRAVLLLQTKSILHSRSFFQLSTYSISQLLSSSVLLPLGMCWGGTGAESQGTEAKRLAQDHTGISNSHETKAWHPRCHAHKRLQWTGIYFTFFCLLMIKMKRLSWHKQLPIQPTLLTPKRMKWTPWNTSKQNPSMYSPQNQKLFLLTIYINNNLNSYNHQNKKINVLSSILFCFFFFFLI